MDNIVVGKLKRDTSINNLWCELQTDKLRTSSRAAYNIRIKEILKKGVLTVIQTLAHLSNNCFYTNSGAFNPPFLKLP